MKKPVIGLNLYFEESGGGFASFPWHALRSNYFDAVRDAGGIPIGLPCTYTNPEDYVNLVDGIIAVGGNDYDPQLYNEPVTSPHVKVMKQRSIFDLALIRATIHQKKPLLAICGGVQALNIVYGGSVHQHIPDTFKTDINHLRKDRLDKEAHSVTITPETHLHDIVHREEIMVNSLHHQALNKIGHGLVINAMSIDGIIEGIEDQTQKFCMGVQWHPEYMVTDSDRQLFHAFIAACR